MEKVAAAMRQIEALRCALMGKEVDANPTATSAEGGAAASAAAGGGDQQQQQQGRNLNVLSESEDEKLPARPPARQLQHPELLSLLLCDGVALPEMNAGESTILVLTLTCTRTAEWIPPAQSGTITFLLCETKDKEANRVIPVDITLVPTEGEGEGDGDGDGDGDAAARPTVAATVLPVPSLPAVEGSPAGRSLPISCRDAVLLPSAAELTNASFPPHLPPAAPAPSFIAIEPGEGVMAATFMRCPVAFVMHSVAYEACKFTMLIRATDGTSFVVLDPLRCCGNSLHSGMLHAATTTSGGGAGGNNNNNSSNSSGGSGSVANVNNAAAGGGGAAAAAASSASTALMPAKTLDAHFKFVPRNGTVRASEPFCITVECTPMSVVPQRYFIPVKNLRHPSDVKYLAVELSPTVEEDLLQVSPKEIRLRDIVVPCEESRLEVQSFVVRTRLTMPHVLLIRSNRPLLVSLFEDAKCTIPLVSPVQRVFSHEKLRIYVRFRPSERTWRHKSRLVTAGILIEALAAGMGNEAHGGYSVLAQTSVRLSAHVGSGEVVLQESFIDLGAVLPRCRLAQTSFTVRNPSDRFEVRLRVTASLTVTHVETPELKLPPRGEVEVPVSLQLAAPGLLRESLVVFNLSCRQKPLQVEVSILRLDEAISAVVVAEDDAPPLPQEQQHAVGLPASAAAAGPLTRRQSSSEEVVVVLPTAAVVIGEDGGLQLHSPVKTAALHMTNHSTRDLILVAKGPAPLVLGLPRPASPVEETAAAAAPSTLSSPVYPRGRVRLDARHTEAVAWTLTSLPQLTEQQARRLLRHEVVTVVETTQVYVAQIIDEGAGFNYTAMLFPMKRSLPAVGQCVLLPRFVLTFAVSEGRVETPLIELGVVGVGGKSGAGGGTPVVVRLTNLSPVLPLRLSIECEPTVRFASNRVVVPPLQTASVEAALLVSLIRTQGPFCFAVYFVNELNPENDMVVYVTGQYYWKLFDLSCDGVMNSAQESLSMEALRVTETTITAATDILSESKLVMTAMEPNVEVGVDVADNPKLAGLIQLQVLQYDAAAALQSIAFGQAKHGTANKAAPAPITAAATNSMNAATSSGGVGGGPGAVSAADAAGISTVSLSAAIAAGAAGVGGNASNGTGGANSSGNAMGTPLATAASMPSPAAAALPALTKPEDLLKGAPPRPREQQSFRLRCLLMRGDFAALSAAFYGQRKLKRADVLRERQAMTFEGLAELERRRGAESPSFWLGTLHFTNSLTSADEEVQVFSTLRAFQTFAVPPRLTLTPQTAAAAAAAAGASPGAGKEGGSGTGGPHYAAETVYAGELVVSNPCAQHTVALSITPLLDRAYQDGVAVSCTQLSEPSPESEGLTMPSAWRGDPDAVGEQQHQQLIARNATGPTGAFSPSPLLSTTSVPAAGALPSPLLTAEASGAGATTTTTTTLVALPPQRVQRVRVMLRVDASRHQPNVEQAVALALFDESVPCSAAVVRIALAPLDEREQQLQKQQQLFLQTTGARVDSRAAAAAAGGGREGPLEEVVDAMDRSTATVTSLRNASPNAAAATPGAGGIHVAGGLAAASGLTHGMPSSSPSSSPAAAAAAAGPPAEAAASPRVLSLHGGCQAVAGCHGTYTCRFTYAKDSPPTTDIAIRNNLAEAVVEYSVAIWSQGPQPWLLLPSATAVLEPGETQPLRLNILSTEAGSFGGYVSITTPAAPGELLLLQLTAEVFLPTAGEGLFEIVASNGQRMATNAERSVFIGRLFGANTHRTYVALEIVNRSSIPLEFPVAVVNPFRMEFNNMPEDGEDLSLAAATNNAAAAEEEEEEAEAEAASAASSRGGAATASSNRGSAHGGGGRATAEGDDGKPQDGAVARPECEVRLLVSHLHNVAEMRGQRRFVVDPKSRVKVSFLLVCDRLSLPSGVAVAGEAEVVLKCKQARDARFVVKARFEVLRPSMHSPRRLFFAAAEDYVLSIPVRNLRSRELRVTFRTTSPILDVLPGEDREGGGDAEERDARERGESGGRPQQQQQGEETAAATEENFTNLRVIPGGGAATVRVRLNVARVTAMLSWRTSGDAAAVLPALSEQVLLLNVRDPSERVRVELCYAPSNAPPALASAAAAARPMTSSLNAGRRQICEQRLFHFAHAFWRVLLEAAEVFLPEFACYAAQKGLDAATAVHAGGGGGGGGGGGSGSSAGRPTAGALASFSPALHSLLVDLAWFVEELVHYSILLSNSRAIEAYGVFLTAVVTGHPLMRAWRQHKANLPNTRNFAVFGQYWETIDALPCPTPSPD
ncbi:uncharacterized protein Tco025E_05107 [Trypanosoma conorhini]|uniref:Uncharacterized protein n=1 Tax=Trypanosoma conorhini TaxID=83891 RepID=A0A422PFX5_9TRYP|nr:uncharacterized protein Tco025E_05107 [Trypanosoma conorhini]RNF16628.1 hypothetical protein Tco025E_05107 [Trypanosoma conorhini]